MRLRARRQRPVIDIGTKRARSRDGTTAHVDDSTYGNCVHKRRKMKVMWLTFGVHPQKNARAWLVASLEILRATATILFRY
jgi:hypothetical protein